MSIALFCLSLLLFTLLHFSFLLLLLFCNLINPLLPFVWPIPSLMNFSSLSSLIALVLTVFYFLLTENNRTPLQRSRSRQNINASSAVVKASHANEAHNEPEGHPSAARSKVAVCSESGRRYRNPPGHSSWLDRERVIEKETVRVAEKKMEIETEPPAFQVTSSGAAVSSCSTNGESDVEALLAKLRAL